MKNPLRIVFMGTPHFATSILNDLIKNNFNVVGVISAPDKPAGRGQKMQSSAVAEFAKKEHLNLLQPEKLKSKKFLEDLKKLNADVFVVVAFRMLPKVVWEIPKLGTFNLHASLLPQYRGAAPINWAIINGEHQTGVTTFLIDEKIDTGNILLTKVVDIFPDETAGELHDKLMKNGGELVMETLHRLANNTLSPQPQPNELTLKDAPKIFKDDCKINWSDKLENIFNFIRGLSPYPTAWTEIHQENSVKTLKIYQASIQFDNHFLTSGKLMQVENKLAVIHREGYVFLNEVQLEGKRKMSSQDFLNGFNLTLNTHLG